MKKYYFQSKIKLLITILIPSMLGINHDFQRPNHKKTFFSKSCAILREKIFLLLKIKIRITRYLKGLEVPDGGAPVLRERHLEVGQLVEGGGAGHQG